MAFLPLIAPALQGISAAAGLVGGLGAAGQASASGAYQAAIAKNEMTVMERNARIAEENANTARENATRLGLAGQTEAQDQDFAATGQMAELQAQQAASGLTGSGQTRALSFLERLAGRDRSRIADATATQTSQVRQQAQDFVVQGADFQTAAQSAGADAKMATANASAAAGQYRLSGFGSLLNGFSGAGDMLLDGRSRNEIITSFNNVFRRKRTV